MGKRLCVCVAFLACAISALGAGSATAARPGDVDPGFGSGGTVVQPGSRDLNQGFYGAVAEDMAIGLEDEVLELQSERRCSGSGACSAKLFVERYWRDGVRDEAFGVGGRSAAAPVAPL